jgi:hypothetical protein
MIVEPSAGWSLCTGAAVAAACFGMGGTGAALTAFPEGGVV